MSIWIGRERRKVEYIDTVVGSGYIDTVVGSGYIDTVVDSGMARISGLGDVVSVQLGLELFLEVDGCD
jgi:hypothetical protein